MRKKLLIFTVLASILYFPALAQYTGDLAKVHVVRGQIIDGDTVAHIVLKEVTVFPTRVFENKYQQMRYTRLVRYVKKVYPYAVAVENLMIEVEDTLQHIPESEQRKYIKMREKELFAQFEGELRELTITQGQILMKLIDRQTGNTTFDLIKDMKGNFNAFFWQSIAVMFGSNLKSDYDPDGDDAMIEEIVILIENGLL